MQTLEHICKSVRELADHSPETPADMELINLFNTRLEKARLHYPNDPFIAAIDPIDGDATCRRLFIHARNLRAGLLTAQG